MADGCFKELLLGKKTIDDQVSALKGSSNKRGVIILIAMVTGLSTVYLPFSVAYHKHKMLMEYAGGIVTAIISFLTLLVVMGLYDLLKDAKMFIEDHLSLLSLAKVEMIPFRTTVAPPTADQKRMNEAFQRNLRKLSSKLNFGVFGYHFGYFEVGITCILLITLTWVAVIFRLGGEATVPSPSASHI